MNTTTRANIPHPINDATGQASAPFDEEKLLQLFCNWECLQRGEKGKAAWEAIIAHIKAYARPAPIGAVAPDATYSVHRNTCDCHPETCCCVDWKIVGPDGKTHSTHGAKSAANQIAALLSAAPAAPDESRALYTPNNWQVREWALEEAAAHIEGCIESIGDSAAYDNREMYDSEMMRMHDMCAAAASIRALSAAPAAPIAEVTAPTDAVAWARNMETDPEFTDDSMIGGYWIRKGYKVTLLYTHSPASPANPPPSLLDTIERERVAGPSKFGSPELQARIMAHAFPERATLVAAQRVQDYLAVRSEMGSGELIHGISGRSGKVVLLASDIAALSQQSLAVDGAPSTVTPWQDRMAAHYVQGNVQCHGAAHFMQQEIADWRAAPSTNSAAERYQWLRDKACDMGGVSAPMCAMLNEEGSFKDLIDGVELDDAIDAAIATMQQSTTDKEST